MPIDATRVIILVIVVVGFVTALVLLRNKLNKACTTGNIYDEKLGRCITDCSTIPFMKYDSSANKCIPNCLDGEKLCGDKGCVSKNMQCIDNSYICKSNEEGCGGSCMNPSTQQCINGKIYENNKVCDSSNAIVCGKNKHCNYNKDSCIDCPDSHVVCGKNNTCCEVGEYCTADGKCSKCDPKDKITCGNTCCNKGKQQCSSDKICVDCDQPLCAGKTCCKKDETCMSDGTCCAASKSYNYNNVTQCCAKDLCANGECCPSGSDCHNGKCMVLCGKSFCDLKDETCVHHTVDGVENHYCVTKGCEWSHLDYIPNDLQISSNEFMRVCQRDGTGGKEPTYYLSKQPDMSTLYRTAQDEVSPTTHAICHDNDCIARLAEDGIMTTEYDDQKKTCLGVFNCMKVLPDKLETCPFTNKKQCCKDSTNKFTGQFCKDDTKGGGDNYGCYDNTCAYGYVCNGDGTCDLNMDPKTTKRVYKSKTDCQNICKPDHLDQNRIFTTTSGTWFGAFGCSSMYSGGVTACSNRASNKQDLNTDYNWKCSVEGDTDPIRADDRCNVFCDCHGTIIDKSIY